MRCAGFVLLGGQSRRMGRDKALLPYGSSTLAEHAAERVLAATGSVALVGDPGKYAHLGHPVIPDRIPDSGPLGGLHAALSASLSDWNLILACDLPYVSVAELKEILEVGTCSSDYQNSCVILQNNAGQLQPLCAAYHRSCLPTIGRALENKRLRVMGLVAELTTIALPAKRPRALINVNTPADWVTVQSDGHHA